MICRFREIHVVNEYGVFQAVYALVGEKSFWTFPEETIINIFGQGATVPDGEDPEPIAIPRQLPPESSQESWQDNSSIGLWGRPGWTGTTSLHHWVSAAGGGWRWPGGVDRSSYQTLRLLFTFATTLCLSFRQILIFYATSVRKLNFIGGML